MKKKLKALSILTAACLFVMPASEAMAYDLGKDDSVNSINQKTSVSTEEAQKDVKISKDKAKEISRNILKDYFNAVIDEKNYNNSISLDAHYDADGKGYNWDMSWRMQNNDKSYDVSIDADTGKVINANIENNGSDNTAVTITESEAKVIAENFLKKVNPEDFKQTKLKEDNDWTRYGKGQLSNYTFTYIRYANSIPFQDNCLFVEVNGAEGKVSSYRCTWNQNIKFPEASNYTSSDKALSLFKGNMAMQLHYVLYDDSYYASKYTNDNSSKQIKLVYMPVYSNGNTLNAITGKFDNNSTNITENKNLTDKEREEFYKKYKAASSTDKEIDKSTAQNIMTKIIKEFYGDGYTISEINYYESNMKDNDVNNKKQWHGNFKKGNKNDKNVQNGYISIDASNGALISINKYNNYGRGNEDIKPAITWQQAYYKAINAVAEYFPDKVKSIETLQTRTINADEINSKSNNRYLGFDFQRKENGAIYDSNNISVNFDVSDGSIRGLTSYWSNDMKFTDTKGIITDKTAKEDYFKNNSPELSYTQYNKSNDYQNPQYEIRLSYVQNDNYLNSCIDALSGKRMTYDGEEIDENIESFLQKIKGNKYEKELFILAKQGIIGTNNFNESKEVTKIDLIKMLVNMKGYKPYMVSDAADLKLSGVAKGSADYKYLQMAVACGIIEDKEEVFDPSSKVTREEMVKSIIKLLGYEKLASNSDIFAVSFKDSSKIDSGYKGAAAIAKGLGIVDGDNLRPKDNATMIELAVTAYKALGNFRD